MLIHLDVKKREIRGCHQWPWPRRVLDDSRPAAGLHARRLLVPKDVHERADIPCREWRMRHAQRVSSLRVN
jgi:hypothetical protein